MAERQKNGLHRDKQNSQKKKLKNIENPEWKKKYEEDKKKERGINRRKIS